MGKESAKQAQVLETTGEEKKKHEARDKENKPKKKQQQIKLSQTLAQPRKRK